MHHQILKNREKGISDTQIYLVAGLALLMPIAGLLPGFKFFSSPASYLPLHTGLEFIAMAFAAMVFTLSWNLRERRDPRYMILGIGFLCVAVIDFGHVLSYPGMPAWITDSGPEKAINFWLAARYVSAFCLLAIALLPLHRTRITLGSYYAGIAAAVAFCLLVFWLGLYHQDDLPDTFVAGQGLTTFKVVNEYILVALFWLSAAFLLRQALARSDQNLAWLAAASWTLGLAELFFTLYTDVTDIHNLLGHIYKAIAYWMIYRGIFASGVLEPYAQLADLAARTRFIIDGTRVGTWEWNVQTGETVFNERWAEIVGYTLAELSPTSIQTWTNLAHPEDLQRSGELLHKHFAGELPYYECETRVRHKAGHWVWVLDRGMVSSRTAEGHPYWMHGTHQDITERKQAELELYDHRHRLEQMVALRTADLEVAMEAAEAANRAKTAFLSIASHELRTPMNGVMGMLTLLKKRTVDPQQLEYLGKADRASRQLLSIINDVLDISRIESNRLTLAETPFTLDEIRTHVLDALQQLAEEKALVLSYPTAPSDQHFIGDPTRITQIMINLVGNAIKFTPAGQVQVNVTEIAGESAGNTRLRFEIRDTGIGILPEDQARIFEPFEQADSSISRKHGGTGLGLALCRKLSIAMGGNIGVISEPGQGSVFWFEVVVAQSVQVEGESEIEVAPGDELMAKFHGANVLLVEDDLLSLEIAEALLEAVGLNVFTAADGIEAIDCARSGGFDLILMDMNMPNMGGIDATYEIRQIPAHATTPIIAMTANVFSEDRETCIRAGMNDHIGKPVTPEVLYKVVLHWLEKVKAAHSKH
jgi:PAS domain S-box-containing protein